MDICANTFTIGNPLRCQGSACVKVMTILHGSAPFLRRCAEGCVPPKGMIAYDRDPLNSTIPLLEPPWPCRIGYQSEFQGILIHSIWVQLRGLELEEAITSLGQMMGWAVGPTGSSSRECAK
ncbi:hypothetical protein CK203_060966 [Vitis vinifera]|uniref:Uncharacterized protein n=1 Tax=Vitis vinifera TaxID=29760 RepID=A0A438G9A9_VITVI|nr:hypothetical protein CK203_060966 [Vitis vinifera]